MSKMKKVLTAIGLAIGSIVIGISLALGVSTIVGMNAFQDVTVQLACKSFLFTPTTIQGSDTNEHNQGGVITSPTSNVGYFIGIDNVSGVWTARFFQPSTMTFIAGSQTVLGKNASNGGFFSNDEFNNSFYVNGSNQFVLLAATQGDQAHDPNCFNLYQLGFQGFPCVTLITLNVDGTIASQVWITPVGNNRNPGVPLVSDIIIDGGNAYLLWANSSSFQFITKVTTGGTFIGFTQVSVVGLASSSTNMVNSTDNASLYIGTGDGLLVKVNKSTLGITASLNLSPTFNRPINSVALNTDTGIIYAFERGVSTVHIVSESSFTQTSTTVLSDSDEPGWKRAFYDSTQQSLFVLTQPGTDTVQRINTVNGGFSLANNITTSLGNVSTDSNSGYYDSSIPALFIATIDNPPKVSKVNVCP